MAYALSAVECAMKARDVILQALAGKLTWLQAADILGRNPRSIRRLRLKFDRYGVDALYDRRRRTPSPKRAPLAEVQRLLALYRDNSGSVAPRWTAHEAKVCRRSWKSAGRSDEQYQGFDVRHFHDGDRERRTRRCGRRPRVSSHDQIIEACVPRAELLQEPKNEPSVPWRY